MALQGVRVDSGIWTHRSDGGSGRCPLREGAEADRAGRAVPDRAALPAQQIALDPRSVDFLLGLGVDFDNVEGCWHNEHFFTKIGVFQEYLLSILEQKKQKVDVRVRLGTKVASLFFFAVF